MRKIVLLALFLMSASASAFAQGGLLPALPGQFLNGSGIVAAGAKLCSFAAGSTTPRDMFTDVGLTTSLPNPNTLNSLGEPTTGGGQRSAIYIDPTLNYKFILYAAGATGTTCPLSGTTLWSQDDVSVASGGGGGGTITASSNTLNHVTKWTGTDVIGDTLMTDNGSTFQVPETFNVVGNAAFGTAFSPSARVNIAVGTTVAGTAPIKLTTASAALMTVPENGAIETDGSDLYFTNDSGIRNLLITAAPGSSDITGTGTAPFLPVFSAATAVINSSIQDNGSNVTIGDFPSITHNAVMFANSSKQLKTDEGSFNWDSTNKDLYVGFGPITDFGSTPSGAIFAAGSGGVFVATGNSATSFMAMTILGGSAASISVGQTGAGSYLPLRIVTGGAETMRVFTTHDVAINTSVDNGYKFDVNGTMHTSGTITDDGNITINGTTSLTGALTANTAAFVSGTQSFGNIVINSNTGVMYGAGLSGSSDIGCTGNGCWINNDAFYTTTAATNASAMGMTVGGGVNATLVSFKTGSGTVRPLVISVNGIIGKYEATGTDRVCIYVSGALHLLSLSGSNIVDGGACP